MPQLLHENHSRKNSLGLERPRVVWDMTFARRGVTGTRVHTQTLFQFLAAHEHWEMRQIWEGQNGASQTLRAKAQRAAWLWVGLEKELQRAQPDLFHAAAYLGPRRAPCPMIVNVFDTTYLAFPRDFDWKWRLYARVVIPATVKRAAAILTDSEFTRGEIVRAYQVPRARVHVVPPGIGAEFRPLADAQTLAALRAKYGLRENYLIHVGEPHPRKNLPVLRAAFAQTRRELPELQLVLVGPRGASDPFALPRAATGGGDGVRVLGYVPQAELIALYGGARAFVYASKMEGFGMPPLEAMACGTPVISVPNPPMPEVLGDAAWFTENDSPAALAAGIVRVLQDDALQNKLRARGIERARLYSWDASARKTIAIYEDVLTHALHRNQES